MPTGYRVPPDNPFVDGGPARAGNLGFGLRNPWRFSFDDPARGGTGALIIGDVGQGALGGNRLRAGGPRRAQLRLAEPRRAHDNVTNLPPAFLPLSIRSSRYDRCSGRSVTGGYVYRGTALGPAISRPLLLR